MEEYKQSRINQYKYHAFISYRHADNKVQGRQWATWLHQAIETYEVPKDLVGKKNGRGDVIPARIYPIFRDEEELPAHADLGTSIVGALEQTNLLVVLCSPRAVASTYVADEIDYFKKLGGSDRIIAAMIDGEPNTSWDDSKLKLGFTKEDECFPIPLQFEYDQDGNPTEKHAEPIAADFRINNDGKPEEGWTTPAAYREHLKTTTQLDNKAIDKKVDSYQQQLHLMLLKIIAGILGVPLGKLTQRDKEYQLEQERLKAKKLRQWLGAVAMLAILALGAGVFAYFQKEEAEMQESIAQAAKKTALIERDKSDKSKKLAITEKNKALTTQSRYLMKSAEVENKQGNFDTALLLALNASPGNYGGDRPEIAYSAPLVDAIYNNNITLSLDKSAVSDYGISENGKYLAAITTDNFLKVWDIGLSLLKVHKKIEEGSKIISISVDGSVVAYSERYASKANLLLVRTGEVLHKIENYLSKRVYLSKDGAKFALKDSTKNNLSIWAAVSPKDKHIWNNIRNININLKSPLSFNEDVPEWLLKTGDQQVCSALLWSNTGQFLFCPELRIIWDLHNKNEPIELPDAKVAERFLISFNNDDSKVAIIDNTKQRKIRVTSTKNNKLIHEFQHPHKVKYLSLNYKEGNLLIVDKEGVKLIPLNKGGLGVKSLKDSAITSVKPSADGKKIMLESGSNSFYILQNDLSKLDLGFNDPSIKSLYQLFWTPHGIYTIRDDTNRIRVINLSKTNVKHEVYIKNLIGPLFSKKQSKILGVKNELVLIGDGSSDGSRVLVADYKNNKVLWKSPFIDKYESCKNNSLFWLDGEEYGEYIEQYDSLINSHSVSDYLSCFEEGIVLPSNSGATQESVKSLATEFRESEKRNAIPVWLSNERKITAVLADKGQYQVQLNFRPEQIHIDAENEVLIMTDSTDISFFRWRSKEKIKEIKGLLVSTIGKNSSGNDDIIITENSWYSPPDDFMKYLKTKLLIYSMPSGEKAFEYSFKKDSLGVMHAIVANNKKEVLILYRQSSNIEKIGLMSVSLKESKILWDKQLPPTIGYSAAIKTNKYNHIIVFDRLHKELSSVISSRSGSELLSFFDGYKPQHYEMINAKELLIINEDNQLEIWDLASAKRKLTILSNELVRNFYIDSEQQLFSLKSNGLSFWGELSNISHSITSHSFLPNNYKCLSITEREEYFLSELEYEKLRQLGCNDQSALSSLIKNLNAEEKRKHLATLFSDNPEDYEISILYANELFERGPQGDLGAIEIYTRLYNEGRLNSVEIEKLALSHFNKKQYDLANKYFSESHKKNTFNQSHSDFAFSLYKLQRYAEAAKLFLENFKHQQTQGYSTSQWTYSLRMYGLSILKSESSDSYDRAHQLVASELQKIDYVNYEWQYSHLTKIASQLASIKGDFIKAVNYQEIYLDKSYLSILSNSFDKKNRGLLQKRAGHYLAWSWYQLYNKEFVSIIMNIPLVIDKLRRNDENTITLHTNLAHAYLLSGDYKSAKAIYEKYKGFTFKDGNTWDKAIIADFKMLEKDGITHPDFSRIAKEVFGVYLDVQSEIDTKEAA